METVIILKHRISEHEAIIVELPTTEVPQFKAWDASAPQVQCMLYSPGYLKVPNHIKLMVDKPFEMDIDGFVINKTAESAKMEKIIGIAKDYDSIFAKVS